jgi:hypothetical protein
MRNVTSVGHTPESHCVESPYQFGICHSEHLPEASIFASTKTTRRLQKIFKLIAPNIDMRNATSKAKFWSPIALNYHINSEYVIPNTSFRISPIRGIHFCEYKNNKATSENILAHCAKYYYEKCDFCWRHSCIESPYQFGLGLWMMTTGEEFSIKDQKQSNVTKLWVWLSRMDYSIENSSQIMPTDTVW